MRNKLLTYIFITTIALAGVLATVLPDASVTFSERRYLYSLEELQVSEDFSSDFEKYVLDHFVFRDAFRRLKAYAEYNLFMKKDNNGLYEHEGYIIKQLYPLDESSIENLADKINRIKELFAVDNGVYYSIIPDKNYFASSDETLTLDYKKMIELLKENVDSEISYIDLFNSLSLSDYYKTDHHFRIDGLSGVLASLGDAMGIDLSVLGKDFILKEFYPFYGAYYGQAAMDIEPDTLFYLDSPLLDSCSVKIWEGFDSFSTYEGVYDLSKLGSIDSYDMFLYGTKPVVEITNPNAENDRELIIFKDSFANSLTPLLMESYSKITLVDLRLVNHTILDNFIEFENQDILFLYSTMVANNSYILK